jgi:hypothetical protein
MSELLREQQCDDEIHQQKNGEHEAGCRNPIAVHGLPQFPAGLDVEKRQGEENHGEQQHDSILHSRSPRCGWNSAGRGSIEAPNSTSQKHAQPRAWDPGPQFSLRPNQPAQTNLILAFASFDNSKELLKIP